MQYLSIERCFDPSVITESRTKVDRKERDDTRHADGGRTRPIEGAGLAAAWQAFSSNHLSLGARYDASEGIAGTYMRVFSKAD